MSRVKHPETLRAGVEALSLRQSYENRTAGRQAAHGEGRAGWGKFTAVVLCVALVALLSACQESDEGVVPTPEDSATSQEGSMVGMDPGISDSRIVFGQSAAFSGPAQALGNEMRLGIQAAFHEVNQAGGVHGRMVELVTLDDFYEPDSAYINTRQLNQ